MELSHAQQFFFDVVKLAHNVSCSDTINSKYGSWIITSMRRCHQSYTASNSKYPHTLLCHREFCSGITTAKKCSFSIGSSGIVVAVGIFEVVIISPFTLRYIITRSMTACFSSWVYVLIFSTPILNALK